MVSFPCHRWLAVSLVLYLTLATLISIRGFLRRTPSPFLSLRDQIASWMRATLAAFEPSLIRIGVRPVQLTYAQFVLSLLAGTTYGMGCIFLGGWLVLACGVLDLLDGGLARRMAQVTRRGAFLDSIVDRYAEFFTFCGLGVFFFRSWMIWVVACGLLGSLMVSYARARAEGLGIECQEGLMRRGERYVLLGGGSFLSTLWNHLACRSTHSLLIVSLLLLALLTNLTAVSRIRAVAITLEDR